MSSPLGGLFDFEVRCRDIRCHPFHNSERQQLRAKLCVLYIFWPIQGAIVKLKNMKSPFYLIFTLSLAATAQTQASCITAGRLDSAGRWAPQFNTVRLLDEAGKPLMATSKPELLRVRSAELTEPALLSACEGEKALQHGDDAPSSKASVPAVKPGKVMVVGVGFPQLQIGGELVELKVQVTPEQTMMVTR